LGVTTFYLHNDGDQQFCLLIIVYLLDHFPW